MLTAKYSKHVSGVFPLWIMKLRSGSLDGYGWPPRLVDHIEDQSRFSRFLNRVVLDLDC